MSSDSMFRDRSFYTLCVLPIGIVIVGLLLLHFLVLQPYIDGIEKQIKDKTQAELNSINSMNCQQLHDKLLSSDHFYDSDNEAIARDHYVAQCGVRLP